MLRKKNTHPYIAWVWLLCFCSPRHRLAGYVALKIRRFAFRCCFPFDFVFEVVEGALVTTLLPLSKKKQQALIVPAVFATNARKKWLRGNLPCKGEKTDPACMAPQKRSGYGLSSRLISFSVLKRHKQDSTTRSLENTHVVSSTGPTKLVVVAFVLAPAPLQVLFLPSRRHGDEPANLRRSRGRLRTDSQG